MPETLTLNPNPRRSLLAFLLGVWGLGLAKTRHMPQTLTLNPGPTKEPLGFLWGMPKVQTLSHGPTLEPLQSFLVGGLNCTCALKPNPVRVHRRSLFLATYFACQDNLSTIREPSQLLAILLELSERKAQEVTQSLQSLERWPALFHDTCRQQHADFECQLQDESECTSGVNRAASLGELGQRHGAISRRSRMRAQVQD